MTGQSHRRALALHGAAVFALLLAAPVGAQDAANPEPAIVGVRVGFSDAYKVGVWTPVEVAVRAGRDKLTGTLHLTVPDGDGTPSVVVAPRRYEILPFQVQAIRAFVKFGQENTTLRAVFDDENRGPIRRTFDSDQVSAQRGEALPFPIEQGHQLIVGVGPSIGLDEAVQLHASDDGAVMTDVVQLPDTRDLPTRWYGYEGVDWLVISTSRPEVFRELTTGGAQIEAILEWVEQGGRVLLCAGAGTAAALAPDTALARLLPARLEGSEVQQGFDAVGVGAAVESYSEIRAPIPGLGSAEQATASIDIALLSPLGGRVELARGDRPLVVRLARGFGQVVVAGLDLDRQPWAGWTGRGPVVNKLLGKPPRRSPESTDANATQNEFGVADLSGQLSDGLSQFPQVRFVSFWVVALMVLVYILLIGPGDYFLVKRVLKRMELTWLTSSLIVIGVSVGAYYFARWLKGDDLRVNQVDIVDVDQTTGEVRGTTWANIFSPNMQTYDLALRPLRLDADARDDLPADAAPDESSVLLSWMGTPGHALGSMGGATPGLWNRSYRFSPALDQMLGVPIQVWSTKAVTARWQTAAAAPLLQANLALENEVLSGTLGNRSGRTWRDCALLVGTRAYQLEDLAPGADADLAALRSKAIGDWLSGVRPQFDEEKHTSIQTGAAFDATNLNVATAVLRMMFYEAGGGLSAAGNIPNVYQGWLDLSHHLALGQAIFVCRCEDAAATLTDDDRPLAGREDQHWTFLRVLVPLDRPSTQDKTPPPAAAPAQTEPLEAPP